MCLSTRCSKTDQATSLYSKAWRAWPGLSLTSSHLTQRSVELGRKWQGSMQRINLLRLSIAIVRLDLRGCVKNEREFRDPGGEERTHIHRRWSSLSCQFKAHCVRDLWRTEPNSCVPSFAVNNSLGLEPWCRPYHSAISTWCTCTETVYARDTLVRQFLLRHGCHSTS
jgi:hypothetical protein